MNILVTGGAGYIGSHAALRLLDDGHAVTIVDDLSRGHVEAVEILRVAGDVHFIQADAGDESVVGAALAERSIDLVMHFGALANVSESFEHPLRYYRSNVSSSIGLLEAMVAAGVHRLIYSSTCAVYGEPPPDAVPIPETCLTSPVSPYGRSKLLVEQAITDLAQARRARGEPFSFAILRYFNVAGCDRSGRLGEDHRPETHLVPICLEAALGQREGVRIYGTDYPTPDGTCVRDYVHVSDLVDAHVTVMSALTSESRSVLNVGVGHGHSVREVVESCRRVTGVNFDVREGARRHGDPPRLFSDPSRLRSSLGWSASVTNLDDIVASAWEWKRKHPRGYASD